MKPTSLQIMYAAHVPTRDQNVVTARALEGHRLVFDPCCSMKVLGSWCDDRGCSSGAFLAGLQAGNRACHKHHGLLTDKMLPIAGRAKAFGTACAASTLHGLETLHLDGVGHRKLKGWEGRCLRKMKYFGKLKLGKAPALHDADRGRPGYRQREERSQVTGSL